MSLKVDLRSKEERRGLSIDYGWIFVIIAIIVAFVAFYLYGLQLENTRAQKEAELKNWQDKVAGFSGIQEKLQSLKTDIGSIQAKINDLHALRYDPFKYSILLVRLSQALPSNIWLGNLSVEPTHITFSGTSMDQPGHPPLASIAQLIMNLQNDKDHYFSNIILQGTNGSEKGKEWTFNLETDYNISLTGQAAASPIPSASKAPAPSSPASQNKISAPSTPESMSPAETEAPSTLKEKKGEASKKIPEKKVEKKKAPETKGGKP